MATKPKRRTRKATAAQVSAPSLPGRRTELTMDLAREISDRVGNGATFKAAALLSGVQLRTGMLWLAKGRDGLDARSEVPDLYVQFFHMVEQAKERMSTMLKLLMRRAAQGTDKRPGDWRAAQALGAITAPKEFVPQLRIHVSSELSAALDRVQLAFADDPVNQEKAMAALSGGGTPEDEETEE